ncbi:MAG: SLC13 family permease [Wenzhouxiangellaceae bacterium]
MDAASLALTTDMMLVLGLVLLAGTLFITEWLRVDVTAITVMVLLGLLELVPSSSLFAGFASNAVMSVIAVMILGAGLDRTGVMNLIAGLVLKLGGTAEHRIQPLVSGTVGIISGFMQNVGAAALFIPVVSRISNRSGIALSRLLMPMGFCAVMGGTLTLVGSSPLILLNDLVAASNRSLPPGASVIESYGLFDVTPVGLALIAVGIAYFLLFGRWILPKGSSSSNDLSRPKHYFADTYGIRGDIFEVLVTVDSPLVGMRIEDAEKLSGSPLILAIRNTDDPRLAPPADEMIWVGTVLGMMGTREQVNQFAQDNELRLQPRLRTFGHLFNPALAGISEVVIPPGSRLINQTVGEARLRSRFGISVLAINRRGDVISDDVRAQTLQSGDCLVSHSSWRDLAALDSERDFIVASDLPKEEARPQKVTQAVIFFAIALGLVLFSDFSLAIALLVGALGMILTGVLSIDEAYQAVSWKSVFLMAGLIPLGGAMETTGAAAWIAQQVLTLFSGLPDIGMQIVLAIMATLFTLIISNVGATILLVPIAINIAIANDANPAIYALIVSLGVSNSFVLPTHQVNALIMGPGGYRVADFMRVGGVLSILYIAVMITVLNLTF